VAAAALGGRRGARPALTRRPLPGALLVALALAVSALRAAEPLPLPPPGTLEGLGVNIHFTDAQPGELEQLAAGGYRLVRMDFAWDGIEREQGAYDFSAYDRLLAALDQHQLRAYFILDYHNRFYDGGDSPRSDAGRAGFCAFAAAALRHFAGRGIVWEMYNEPNIFFWKPKPSVDDYAKLALAVGATVRKVAPRELYVGPATSEIDPRFLERCFAAGCLQYWDAVSVHPYRHRAPETAAEDYRALRQLIARYAPRDAGGQPKAIPLLSGEWGYSSAGWGQGYDEALQGRYLPRQWLTNLANDVLISVWYDWHEDGADANEGEHHFGSVRFPYLAGQAEVYQPKPAYLAARTLAGELHGLRFDKALALGEAEHVLLFSGPAGERLVAWSSKPGGSTVVVPVSAGRFRAASHLGEAKGMLDAGPAGLTLALSEDPLYLAPEGANEALRLAAAWQRLPLDCLVEAPGEALASARFTNPLDHPLAVSFGGEATTVAPGMSAVGTLRVVIGEREESTHTLALAVAGRTVWTQATRVVTRNPLAGAALGVRSRDGAWQLEVRIDNPSGEPFAGTVALTEADGLAAAEPQVGIAIAAGVREQRVLLALKGAPAGDYRAGIVVRDLSGASWRTVPAHRFHRLAELTAESAGTAWKVVEDGDARVAASATLAGEAATPMSGAAGHALLLTYRLAKGWKFLRVVPAGDLPLPGRPSALALWVRSDGSGNLLRMRVVDAGGQTFQCDAGRLTEPGWQYRTFPIDLGAAHWGGQNDGIVHYPLRLDCLLLLDHGDQAAESAGAVALAAPMLIE
jgi:hypothetical protein